MADVKENTHDENVCDYYLFPPDCEPKETQNLTDYLEESRDTYLAEVWPSLIKYIWQNEPFRLRSVDVAQVPHLHGRTDYGDNVEDEWFIVHLLFQLTKTFPGLVAKICDSDGEFMLIEAAEVLPKWINPDTAQNRVFIYNGRLHIIPLAQSPAELTPLPSGVPSLSDAVRCVRDQTISTVAAESIQDMIQKRIGDYPEKIQQSMHRAHCYVPAALACVLKHSPQLLAPGVQAFYHRDPIDLKACTIMTHFRPGTRVMTEVVFTKCLYAQLTQQKFQPRGDWTIPSGTSPKFKAYDTGMKLAHGFEILCSQCKNNGTSGVGGGKRNTQRWPTFLQSLKNKGYFKGEIEGSKKYVELYEEAKQFYESTVQPQDCNQQLPGAEILKILKTEKVDIEDLRKQEKYLQSPDDDGWLDLTPDVLDAMLTKAAGKKSGDIDLSSIADSVKAFVNQESGLEGAEVAGQGNEDEIQFDSGGFIQSMEKIFEFDDPQSDSDSDMSEYGCDASDDEYGLVTPQKQKKGKKSTKPSSTSSSKSKEDVKKITDYMEMMDRELAKTEVGKSFESQTKPTPPPRTKKIQKKLKEQEARANTTLSPPAPQGRTSSDLSDIDALDDDFTPVNVDMNTVKNLLESYTSQHGLAGPTSNLLGSMKTPAKK